MQLKLDLKLSEKYHSMSQKVKNMTEHWVGKEVFCPACGCAIEHFENNRPVADFFCQNCKEEYELKSKKDAIGNKIMDGAYRTMIERLQSNNNPNFFLMNYNLKNLEIFNFLVIPKHFFVPSMVIRRERGLKDRPDYIMCSLDISSIPSSGQIFYVKNGLVESKDVILDGWKRTLFLREEKQLEAKGWLLDTMNCIDKIGKNEFSLDEIYSFEKYLKTKHPNNNFIKDKLRQQLQVLRDKGYLEFVTRGKYKLAI